MVIPGCTSGKEPTCQCRKYKRLGFYPWVGKLPWRRAWQPTSVFLPGESPWTEESGGLLSIRSQRVWCDKWLTMHAFKYIFKPCGLKFQGVETSVRWSTNGDLCFPMGKYWFLDSVKGWGDLFNPVSMLLQKKKEGIILIYFLPTHKFAEYIHLKTNFS